MSRPESVTIVEVGPRDELPFEEWGAGVAPLLEWELGPRVAGGLD